MKKFLIGMVLLTILVSVCMNGCTPPPISPGPAPLSSPDLPGPTVTQAATGSTSELPASATIPAPTATTAASQTPSASLTPYAIGPDNFPETINPLTGLPVSEPNALNRRPMAVKVQLYPRGQRPVYGISMADIVFDYTQNDGLTRLNAIFYGADASQIGPVRSARLFDENIIRMYKALFAFGGAAQYVLNRFYNADYADRLVTEGNDKCPPMCRVDPNGFNYLFTSSPELALYALAQGIPNGRQNLQGMSFNTQSPADGQPAEQITTRYSISSYNRWDYDPASKRYLRLQDTQEDNNGQGEAFAPLVDGLTNQQIAADNVVVLILPHQSAEVTGDKDALDIRLSGSGEAYAFRDGQGYQVHWNRPTKESALFLTFEDGQLYPFKPGTTWFQVVGMSSKVENPGDGAWRFKSQLP